MGRKGMGGKGMGGKGMGEVFIIQRWRWSLDSKESRVVADTTS